jgi:hypothetical protein
VARECSNEQALAQLAVLILLAVTTFILPSRAATGRVDVAVAKAGLIVGAGAGGGCQLMVVANIVSGSRV